MLELFQHLADYNRWANRRLYEAVADLSEPRLWRDIGLYFDSLGGTLNHLLVADRIWLKRFTGEGEHPERLDAILHRDLVSLRGAREQEDQRLLDFVAGLTPAALTGTYTYQRMTTSEWITSPLQWDLTHVFNHHTHHRGQAHAGLSLLGLAEPPPLDFLYYMRARATAT